METLNNKTLHKNFILIHEFLYPGEPIKGWVRDDETYTGQYHQDWECLIDVVHKCLDICHEELLNEWEEVFCDAFLSISITKMYHEVVEFIKWHNQNQKGS
jgi:hypothetical protein